MMNMLIAIMGDTFITNLEVRDLVIMKVKLKFIIDNWWFDAIGEKKKRIKYVIAALSKDDVDHQEGEIIKNVYTNFTELKSSQ